MKVKDGYKQKLNDLYQVYVNSVDFANRETPYLINAWVGNATRGLISEIVTPDTVYGDKALLILNALYFKGKWRRMFSEKYTAVKCFQTPDGRCTQVPMMQVVDTFNYNYVPNLDAQAVTLPYDVSSTYNLTIFLFITQSNRMANTRCLFYCQVREAT